MPFTLTSPVFKEGEHIPSKYTCDGENISPELFIGGIPEGTVSLALLMDDPDIPKELYPDGGEFDHWVLFNIPADVTHIMENDTVGTPGANSGGKTGYTGPCPPSNYEPKEHRYFFRVYALDSSLPLAEAATKAEVLAAMEGHTLATAVLVGRYVRT